MLCPRVPTGQGHDRELVEGDPFPDNRFYLIPPTVAGVIPSEEQLDCAIDALSTWEFEKLAARWAAIEFGDRFASLQIHGRTTEGAHTPRWPDAFVVGPNGAWDCIEVTKSASWKGVHEHLRQKDLPRIEGDLDVSGFVMIAWCEPPGQRALKNAREELEGAGVSAEEIDFVFRGRLVDSLQDRRYAHLWSDLLGMAPWASPFQLLRPDRGLAELDAESGALYPSWSEFEAGLVREHSALPAVVDRLRRFRFADVRGHGAMGKTVMAEQVAREHMAADRPEIVADPGEEGREEPPLANRPVYYLRLGTLEGGGRRDPVIALTELAAPGVLFVIDDAHLNASVAREIRVAWEENEKGSQMLQLGRLWKIDSRPGGFGHDDAEALTPSVGEGDLVGVYRRLARLRAGDADPPEPPAEEVERWLERFQGDLVVFGEAVMARVEDMLREEKGEVRWQLSPDDARESVSERYLQRGRMDEGERRDLLCLAVAAEAELGVPTAAVRSGFSSSNAEGVVLKLQREWGRGEFQLAHHGLGQLLIAASQERPDQEELVSWGRQDASFAMRMGAHLWAEGGNELAERMLRVAIEDSDANVAIFSLPSTTIGVLLEGMEALEVIDPGELDARLASGGDRIVDAMLDEPARIGPILKTLGESFPAARAAAVDLLRDNAATGPKLLTALAGFVSPGHRLGGWVGNCPELVPVLAGALDEPGALARLVTAAEDLAQLLGTEPMGKVLQSMADFPGSLRAATEDDPTLVALIARGVVDGDLHCLPRAVRLLARSSGTLAAELRREATDPESAGRWRRAARLAPVQLDGLLRFAHGYDLDLQEQIESEIPESARERLVEKLVAQPVTFSRLESARPSWSPLLSELTSAARERGAVRVSAAPRRDGTRPSLQWSSSILARQLAEDPTRALSMDLRPVLSFVNEAASAADDGTVPWRRAGAEVAGVLAAEQHREMLARRILQLPPSPFVDWARWASRWAPGLLAAILSRLESEASLTSFADVCVGLGTFDHIAGLLELLGEAAPATGERLEGLLVVPDRLGQFVSAGFHSSPSGWGAVLSREALAAACLPAVEPRLWRRYWSRRMAESPAWLLLVERALTVHGYDALRAAPAEHVLLTGEKGHWHGTNLALGQLGSALSNGRALGEEAALDFLERIDHRALLDRQYGDDATNWSVAMFLNAVASFQGPEVLDAILTMSFSRRVYRESERNWRHRPEDAAGLLALVGAMRVADLPVSMPPIPADVAAEAIATVRAPGGTLTVGHALVWTGLEAVVTMSESAIRLPNEDVPARHLAMFHAIEPPDERAAETNARLIAWMERAEALGWELVPGEPA